MFQLASIKWSFIFLIVPIILGGIVALVLIPFGSPEGPLLSILLVYLFLFLPFGLYPLFLKTEEFYLKMGYPNVIFEYELIKKLLFVLVPLTVSYLFYYYTIGLPAYTNNAVYLYLALLNYVGMAAILRFITQIGKKEFRFYFAKGCCKIISEKEDDFEKMKYLRLLLRSYDKYLKRRLKAGIDENKIYSIILYKNAEERSKIINSICQSLEGDKLGLAKYLSTIHKVPDSEFYIEETFLQQLKPIGVILAAAIPIVVSVVGLIMRL